MGTDDAALYYSIASIEEQAHCPEGVLEGDINGDCDVDILDFAILAGDWLK